MKSIRFDEGFKEYAINGDENRVIRVNPSDFAIIGRLEEVFAWSKEYRPDSSANGIGDADRAIREKIDYVFGDGIADTAFGRTNCASLANGRPIYQNFLEALMPVIKADIEAEKKKSDANIKKYTSQIK